jgi:hypothetical protein
MQCGQAYCKDLLTRIPRKFIFYFSESYFILNEFLEFLLEKRKIGKWRKSMNSVGPLLILRPIRPKVGPCHWHGVDACDKTTLEMMGPSFRIQIG